LKTSLLKAFYTKLLQTQRNFVVHCFLIFFGLAFITMIEEDEGEEKQAHHH
jgi:large-conductance mechanosensitive channel